MREPGNGCALSIRRQPPQAERLLGFGCPASGENQLTAPEVLLRRGGDRIENDNPKWRVARLDEIERRGRDLPVREHLGIRAFGVNAFTAGEDGLLINEHDEAGSGQEELYLVLDGKATFEVDGETVEAPAGTFVFVQPEARRKATGAGTILALGGTPGEPYQAIDWGEAWSFHGKSISAYGEQRYSDAVEAVRRWPRADARPPRAPLQLRMLRDARRRLERRDVRPPQAISGACFRASMRAIEKGGGGGFLLRIAHGSAETAPLIA